MLAAAARGVAEVLFPARCVGCGLRGTPLCAACRSGLVGVPGGACPRCSALLGPGGACRGCRQLSPALNVIRAALAYDGAARAAVLTLKFRSGRYLVPTLGEFLRAELARRPMPADVIVPVPLSAQRLRQRGYNQARLLAEQLSLPPEPKPVIDALQRTQRPAQQTLSAPARLTNLHGAVRCHRPAAIAGKQVLLIDDVVTTGATLSACADALASAGAREVSALAFARDL